MSALRCVSGWALFNVGLIALNAVSLRNNVASAQWGAAAVQTALIAWCAYWGLRYQREKAWPRCGVTVIRTDDLVLFCDRPRPHFGLHHAVFTTAVASSDFGDSLDITTQATLMPRSAVTFELLVDGHIAAMYKTVRQ